MKKFFFPLALLLALSACSNLTNVQKDYVSHRDDCRSVAEDRLRVYNRPDTYPMGDRERNNALLALFSECMKEYDWKVAGGPKKDEKKEAAAKEAKEKEAAAKAGAPNGAYIPPAGYALIPVVPATPAVATPAPAVVTPVKPAAPMVSTYPVAPVPPAKPLANDFVSSHPVSPPAPPRAEGEMIKSYAPPPAAAAPAPRPIGGQGVIYQKPPSPPAPVIAPPASPAPATPPDPAHLLNILEKD